MRFIRKITPDYRIKNEKLKMQNERLVDIDKRTFQFSLRIVRLCQKLDERPGVGRTLSRQVLRSGTSIGANVEEAQAAQSRADFLSKLNIALKEARETNYWLRLIKESEIVKPDLLSAILKEAEELAKIIAAILCSTRRKEA
jgi:four helix bundle protein